MKSRGPVVSTTQPYNGVKKTLKYCDKYHSTYVPPKPSGARGLFMYLESPLMLLLMGSFAAIVGKYRIPYDPHHTSFKWSCTYYHFMNTRNLT